LASVRTLTLPTQRSLSSFGVRNSLRDIADLHRGYRASPDIVQRPFDLRAIPVNGKTDLSLVLYN
jgi:hypothetical protein